jgi:hypothetical protein
MDYPYSKSIDRKINKVRNGQPLFSRKNKGGLALMPITYGGCKTLTGTTYSATINDLLAIVI